MANIIVRRANVILNVPAEQQNEYLAKGFDVVDDKNKVIVESLSTNDPVSLHKKLAEAHEKIKALQEENEQLKKQLRSKAKPVEKKQESEPEEPQESKPVQGFTPINKRKPQNKTKK